MRSYDNVLFTKMLTEISKQKTKNIVEIKIIDQDVSSLLYFLTKNFYYAVIIDDYPVEIIDESSLLEALYYQIKLITVHSLNWNAIQEGLNDAVNIFSAFNGICLLFRNGKKMKETIPREYDVLSKLIIKINEKNNTKQIKLIINIM
jgi:hypothetical protein